MAKAELLIHSKPDDGFLKGSCSACQRVHFTLPGNTLKYKEMLRKMFDNHFQRVHSKESKDSAA
jgi:hypothetical protein